MALTVTRLSGPHSIGSRFETVSTVAADTSYPTGGWALANTDLGLASTVDPTYHVEAFTQGGYVPEYDHTNSKLKLYRQTAATAALAEVSNGVDVSAAVTAMRVRATGKFRG